MKKIFVIMLLVIICSSLVACTSTNTTIEPTVEAATVATTSDGKFMEVEILANEDFSAGCEVWKKNEEIIFTITSEEKIELEIGILPILEDRSYGELYGEICNVSRDGEVVKIKVPSDGEYGISFINKTNSNVSFKVELNKSLENPLV